MTMNKPKFTKGPWHVTKDWQKKIRDKDNRAVAETVLKNKGNYQDNYELQIANANLIAAAPEMYELLMEILYFADFSSEDRHYYNEIDKVLAKARGEK